MSKPKDLVKLKSSPVSDSDRLRFTLFIAISFHLLLVLGIRFVLPESKESQIPLSLDVTLAQRESLKAPEKADFIGQANQQGAGEAELAERPTTELENFKNTEGETTTPSLEIIPELYQSQQELQLLTTTVDSKQQVKDLVISENEQNTPEQIDKPTEISPPPETLKQFNVEQGINQQLQTRGLKKRQISAAVMASPDDAAYLEAWRNKVLKVGNLHYAPNADRLGYGSPMLKVSIGQDGQLIAVSIQQSSGNKSLDDMALQLIKLSAPFDPLPESIRKDTDILEIIRLLRFHPTKGLSSQ